MNMSGSTDSTTAQPTMHSRNSLTGNMQSAALDKGVASNLQGDTSAVISTEPDNTFSIPYRISPTCKKRRASFEAPSRNVKPKLDADGCGTGPRTITPLPNVLDNSDESANSLGNVGDDIMLEEGEVNSKLKCKISPEEKKIIGLGASNWVGPLPDVTKCSTTQRPCFHHRQLWMFYTVRISLRQHNQSLI